MAINLKVQVLAIDQPQKRKYKDREWFERQLQCIAEQKVFVYRAFAAVGDSDEAKAEQKELASYKEGFYMAELEFQQGDRAKAIFVLNNFQPIKQAQANT